ncbi:Doxorubicin resistance ABC transporter permease protein DrrB [Mycobacterium attenuatum]|uniref:Doxorubicin resistance ABC transporter permease protein DrrB n=1 Tax=Mycobacterium attenuatum TaxID=2341086 RepID=A0A498PY96_9MYCO|nr:antibiotic ABC transporter permease [Mycobacterium attenuatum]VBA37055.1 Doxorubicin resistance ABC transporter permease protein DrrB [Mycobacterium attenuatum]VBA49894.1 Doxorubicin resistance ABC transporter permease protein DrrB [Mycobacterium attenuatum]
MSAPALEPAIGTTAERPATRQPRQSPFRQWWVLVVRLLLNTHFGEVLTTAGAPVVFMVGFYIPFSIPWNHFVGGSNVASSLGQYITPLVTLQAVAFAAIGSGFRAAIDSQLGVNRRFASMPIAALTPVLARVSISLYRCSIGLSVSMISGYVIGFRFHRGPVCIVGFCLLVLVIGALLSFGADLLGTGTKNPDAMLPLLTLPILIFGLLSVGLMPLKLFPRWIHPFVRNQPISQFVEALRALAGDTTKHAIQLTWPVMAPTLAWVVGFIVLLVPMSIFVLSERR